MPPTHVSRPGLAHRLDGAQAALVANGASTPRRSSSRPSRRCGARAGCPPPCSALARVGGHVPDRGAALEVGVLGHQPRALEDLLEVALGEPLALGDHAEAVRARGLGGAGVLEDLLGVHHRVHRRLGLGEARLRAEAAVLSAAARLGVDQRAHVGRVAKRSTRASQARSTSASISAWSSISPSCRASSRVISGGICGDLRYVVDGERYGSLRTARSTHERAPWMLIAGRLATAARRAVCLLSLFL